MSNGVRIRAESWKKCCTMRAATGHGMLRAPRRAGGVITRIFPAENALASPTVYEVAPKNCLNYSGACARKIGASRHLSFASASENVPSPRDIELAAYPNEAYFIISPLAPRRACPRIFHSGWPCGKNWRFVIADV